MVAPKLRFKEFDGDWSRYKIAEVTEYLVDGTHFSPKTTEGEFKYITSKNIRNDGLDLTNISYISKDEHEKIYKRCKVQLGDILLTKDGANTGNCCLNTLDEEFSLLSSVAVLRGKKDSFNNNFILQILQSDLGQDTIISSMSGQAITRITLAKLKDYSFFFPELTEQTQITSFLSAVDEKISQLTQKHALLSQYKQGMMQKLFSQQIRFKADDGSEFGEWEEKELKEVAEINPKAKKLPANFIYIDLESVEKGQLLLQKNIELQDAPSRAQRLLAKGDVLFQMVRPYQQNNYYFNLSGEYVASTGYAQIRTKLDSKFIYYALHEKTFLDEVMNRCTGTSYPAINSSDLSSIEIFVPCLEEQTKIANFLSAIDQKIEVVAQQIEQAKTWKKGLLQQMFV
ncbi:type I restriction modification DNA specificity domain protein [Acinetobacter junii SH205]|uniref:Type I restriction modification DNA specificity domain protein n=1 Tax=Acinetobacter junii SH205 TaxID=575587 RepID=D0SR86_ACIJU|nr:restriction endonuclease subunit S [Acinetobacter junii]EEY91497.1 type I restriction modification DNA specificity domain protein [Acinetobacter junii SH205]